MRTYVIRRVLLFIPTLVGLAILIFILVRLVPGDIARLYCEWCNDEQLEAIRHDLGTDKSIPLQFMDWVGQLMSGDFGESLRGPHAVLPTLVERIPVSAELAVLALLMSLLVSLPVGIIAAIRQDTGLDYVTRVISILFLAVPGFWLATLILTLPAYWWQWSPLTTYKDIWDDPVHNLAQMSIPAALLGLASGALFMRLMRSSLLEVLRQDYIRTAWSKGLAERVVIARHAIKNAVIPVVTLVGVQFSVLLGGTVIMEQIFALPGVGRLTFDAILERDYPQIQVNVMFIGVVYLVMNLIVDLSYGWLDPRVRYQ